MNSRPIRVLPSPAAPSTRITLPLRIPPKKMGLQDVQGGDDRAARIAQQAREVLRPEQADRVAVQEDQHIPMAERFNAQGLEPAFDLMVWRVFPIHSVRHCYSIAGQDAETLPCSA